MKKIGLFTSGGDSPGMNACIRAVVRSAIYHNVSVVGIMRGYVGLISGEMMSMDIGSVSNIIQQGGTILKTARSKEFRTKEGREAAAQNIKKWGIDGLVAIGGDGTFRGASDFNEEHGIPIIGVPGTIDNDIRGTDFTIGYDTAINTALDSIDRIRDTAASHDRIFFIEVMGRHTGFIALDVGVAGGAEYILIPEVMTDIDKVSQLLLHGIQRGKNSSIVIVAEGDEEGGAYKIAEMVKEKTGIDYRVTILGHIQRGGSPTVRDRVLASKLGAGAVELLIEGVSGVMVGEINNKMEPTPLENIWDGKKEIDKNLIRLAEMLSI
ncbi:6-phosphofructokinase [Candidatus Poribacteria bacterium]|nr:6-phosphofructokinase [Candidatus Poribacteria bacterium]